MHHRISDLTRKVSVMYDMSLRLHRLKYDTPLEKQDRHLIDHLIADIQAMAGDIYNDREPYAMRSIDEDFEILAV